MQAQISGMQEKKPAALTEEAIESYLQSVASQGRTKGTLENYRRSLSKFFQWLPGEKLLSQETVEAYRGHMIEDLHYTPNSINMNLTPPSTPFWRIWGCGTTRSQWLLWRKPSTSRR